MLASIPSASLLGATGIPVRVEVHVGKGLPGFRIVGQPDPACRESRIYEPLISVAKHS